MLIDYKFDPSIEVKRDKDFVTCTIKAPKVVLVNEFNDEAAKQFRDDFSEAIHTGQKVIPVVIDSFGGYVYSLLSMVDTIRSCPIDVATIATGKAMSCGAVLFTCGKEGMRYIAPEATLMIHDVSSWAFGKVGKMKVSVDEAARLNRRIYRIMESNIGKKKKYIWNLLEKDNREDWYIAAKEAVKHNLANHIGVPSITISVTDSFSFK